MVSGGELGGCTNMIGIKVVQFTWAQGEDVGD